ncbi:CHASE domain-containing protein [Benzoatithermus flavus]|uniref:histidine kinase n=1 Tax=Benzoatithermus flavus TaxID=3108223 RepID=A0ABU8XWR7_9PROT
MSAAAAEIATERSDAPPGPAAAGPEPGRRLAALRRLLRRRPTILPVLVLVVGTTCTLLAAWQVARVAAERDLERFHYLTRQGLDAIRDRLDTHIALLRATAGLFAAESGVSAEAFRAYADRLRLRELYPGVQGIGFARRVARGEEETLVAAMRRLAGHAGFRLWPESVGAEERTAILYLEPLDARNRAALGFDMFTEPTRRAAMARARDTGEAAASGRVELVQEIDPAHKQAGFLVYVPVYAGGAVPPTTALRRERLVGWAYSPFRAGDLLRHVLPQGEAPDRAPELAFAVHAGTAPLPASLLHASEPLPPAAAVPAPGRYRAVLPLEVAGTPWVVAFTTRAGFERGSSRDLAPWLAAAGLSATLVLAGAALAQARAAAAAETAREALRELNLSLERRVAARTLLLERARDALRAANANLEAAVAARTAELAAANEEVQRFAYIVSHDLRAPLVNVMGFTSELEVAQGRIARFYRAVAETAPGLAGTEIEAAIEQDLPEAIGFIRSSTAKMDRLINAILKLSREGRRTLQPERIELQELLEAIARSLAHQLEAAGVELRIEAPVTLESDRLALEQIFGNLLENAVKYRDPVRPGWIAVCGRASSEATVAVEVTDNGRGIDPRDHERIFDLFRRAGAQDQPGEGIGLAHVRALVRRLGGTIGLRSAPGAGTTFRVTLPRTLPSRAEKGAEA